VNNITERPPASRYSEFARANTTRLDERNCPMPDISNQPPANRQSVNYLPYSILSGVIIERPTDCGAAREQKARENAPRGLLAWLGRARGWWRGRAPLGAAAAHPLQNHRAGV